MGRALPTGNPRVHWQAGLSQAHIHRDGQPGFGCFDFTREMLLAGSLNIQAVRFSFRNTSVLNRGFGNGDRGALATYKPVAGDPCDTDTTRYNVTMGPAKPTASSNTLMLVLLCGGNGRIAPIPSTTPRTWALHCPSHILLLPLPHTQRLQPPKPAAGVA